MHLTLDPGPLAALLLLGLLYVRAVRILRRRGRRVGAGQQVSWWVGLGLLTAALVSPLDFYADRLLSAHMAQHLLLGDIAAPFLLAGVRSPVLLFLLPRPALVWLARRHGLRRAFRGLRRPLVAFGVYVAVLYAWHVGFAFQGALRHPLLHVLQHQSFLAANLLLWWPVLEPQRARVPGDLWKIGYVFAARMASFFLGMAFLFSKGEIYGGFYGARPAALGFSAHADQQTAGGMMMTLDILIMVLALCFFFWHAARQSEPSETGEPSAMARAAT